MQTDCGNLLARYSSLSLRERFHITSRFRACPWGRILGGFPKGKVVAETGCGHGLLLNLLDMSDASIELLAGFDPDRRKIAVALRSARGRLKFYGEDDNFPPAGVDTWAVFDVLYLMPFEEQEMLITAIHARLPDGGHLVIKELDTKPWAKFVFAYCEELVMVRLFGATLGRRFYFRSSKAWRELTEKCGFQTEVLDLQRGFPHPHVMLVCKKKTSPSRAPDASAANFAA